MTRPVDLLIEAGAMLPFTETDVIYDPIVAIEGNRIVYAGERRNAPTSFSAEAVIRDPDAIVMPGFVDTHTHVGAHFWGTLCDDENIITALYDLWFPMEAAFDADITYAACRIGYWDALRAGVTTVANDEYFPDATARAAESLGSRSLVANRINEFALDKPPCYSRETRTYDLEYDRAKAEASFAENLEFIERWSNHDLVRPCLGPHAPDLLSTEMLQECASAAERLGVKMLIHVAQSQAEVAHVRRKGFRGSIHYLQEIGFLSPLVQAAHMVWLDDEEINIAATSGMGMSWTPTIMMACQSYARIPQLMASGVKMGFGTDCFSMDVLEELRYAVYGVNYVYRDQEFQLKADTLLRAAVVGGAECLGLADEIGTLEEGKRADLVVINMRDAQLVPTTNFAESLVYRAKSRDVTHTIVDGRIVYENGRLTVANQDEIFEEGRELAREWVKRSLPVLERYGVTNRIQPHFFEQDRLRAMAEG
ncbi:MAG: amidohydrolase family protein [Candidatus Binatia bacterium]